MLIPWHEHDFSIPFYGHLMCSGVTCAEVITTEGRKLTEGQRDEVTTQMLIKWNSRE